MWYLVRESGLKVVESHQLIDDASDSSSINEPELEVGNKRLLCIDFLNIKDRNCSTAFDIYKIQHGKKSYPKIATFPPLIFWSTRNNLFLLIFTDLLFIFEINHVPIMPGFHSEYYTVVFQFHVFSEAKICYWDNQKPIFKYSRDIRCNRWTEKLKSFKNCQDQ